MRRMRVGIAAAVVCAVVGVNHAEAGRRARTGTVVSPFGPLYNTGSAEWKMSGGNPFVYEQIMEQKMLVQQQQMMLKQQQQAMKAGKGQGSVQPSLPLQPPPRKKKRRTYVPTGATAKGASGTVPAPAPTSGPVGGPKASEGPPPPP